LELWGLYITSFDLKVPARHNVEESTNDAAVTANDAEDVLRMFPTSPPNGQPVEDEDSTSEHRNRRKVEGDRKYRSDIQILRKYPPLLISPLFSYLAILVLRLPIPLSDIYLYHLSNATYYRWMKTEQIPYTRADRLIPPQMLKRLHRNTQMRFTVNVITFQPPLIID
jgi:hypothetical protein